MQEPVSRLVPHDAMLLERARVQWQFGDWDGLAALDRVTLQHHPERGRLALLAATGYLQKGNTDAAGELLQLAQDWGCSRKHISQILISGLHNTLGRAAAVAGQESRALKHFECAIAIGAPGSEVRLIAQGRADHQLSQLGLAQIGILTPLGEHRQTQTAPALAEQIPDSILVLQQQNKELAARLSKQGEDLNKLRQGLEKEIKKEVQNSTKQLQALIGLQSYFSTGDLPNVNTERHSWPVSPDFALYLVELIELNDYDLIIEFGSGISTVILAKAIVKMAPRRQGKPAVEFVSFDHLEQYYQQTLTQLKHGGLADTVKLQYAPLKDYMAPDGKVYPYYDCQGVLSDLARRHPPHGLRLLVVIDGPPAATGPHARYPAGPIILAHFKGARIDLLLDDYIRDDEKQIAERWQSELEAARLPFTVTQRKLEKDACLMSVGANATGVS